MFTSKAVNAKENSNHEYAELKLCLGYLLRKSEDERRGFLAFDVFKFTQFNVSQELLNTLCSLHADITLYQVSVNDYISEEQFAILIVPILFALPISQYSSTNKISIKIRNSYGFFVNDKADNHVAD